MADLHVSIGGCGKLTFGVAVLLLVACGHDTMNRDTQPIPTITVAELYRQHEAGECFCLLDVRTDPEYDNAHLPFTDLLIPYDEVPNHIDQLPDDTSMPIYSFCRSGRRSGIVTEYLVARGYRRARNVSGGIIAWVEADLPIESGPFEK